MDNLQNIKIIKTIKQNVTYQNEKITAIVYLIEQENNGVKYIEFWRTYPNYGSVSLLYGITSEDYKKQPQRFEDQALNEAIVEYIKTEF